MRSARPHPKTQGPIADLIDLRASQSLVAHAQSVLGFCHRCFPRRRSLLPPPSPPPPASPPSPSEARSCRSRSASRRKRRLRAAATCCCCVLLLRAAAASCRCVLLLRAAAACCCCVLLRAAAGCCGLLPAATGCCRSPRCAAADRLALESRWCSAGATARRSARAPCAMPSTCSARAGSAVSCAAAWPSRGRQ